jgi:hypothetical protein
VAGHLLGMLKPSIVLQVDRDAGRPLLPVQSRIVNESLINYNAMEIWNFELFTTKAEEARTECECITAVRDYWITRVELERTVGGSLNPSQLADDKSQPVLPSKAKDAWEK